jgi:hypothetical protein
MLADFSCHLNADRERVQDRRRVSRTAVRTTRPPSREDRRARAARGLLKEERGYLAGASRKA